MATQHVPVVLRLPQKYPAEPPDAYVIPGGGTVLNFASGLLVTRDGKVQVPYLAAWKRGVSNIHLLLHC